MDVDERPPSFADLLQQSMLLVSSLDEVTEMPTVQRNIEQIERASRDLLQKHARPGDGAALKGQYLLATHGIDPEESKRNLDALNLKTTFEPLEPVEDTDVQSYLRHEYDMLILTAIEEAKKNTIAEFNANHSRNMVNQWEAEKREILETLGRIPEAADFTQEATPIATGASDGPLFAVGRSSLNARMLAYLRVVRALNDHRISRRQFGVIAAFREAVSRIDDMRKKEISDCFWILASMANETGADANGEFSRGGLSLGEYAQSYGSPSAAGRINAQFVRGSLEFLRRQYRDHVAETVARNPQRAVIGGQPTTLNHVRGFLRILFPSIPPEMEDVTHDGPFWPTVYFSLRCGDVASARAVAESVASSGGLLADFAQLMREYAESDGRLSAASTQKLLTISKRVSSRGANSGGSADPYKLTVLNLIGRLDDQTFVVPDATIEDFLWFKLMMLRPDSNDVDRGAGTLDALQGILRNYEPHFRKQANPIVFFRVLLLSAQFEWAVDYLAQFEQYRTEAVHFAVALAHYGLLRLPVDPHAETLSAFDGRAHLNYARLLISYTHGFMRTDPADALEYYNLLSEVKIAGGQSLFGPCVRDLVIETREYDAIIGSVAPDGLRRPGAIDRFIRDKRQLASIIEDIAVDCEDRGLFHDAIALYDLAESAERVLSLLNRQLGQVLALPSAPLSDREQLRQIAHKVEERLGAPTRTGTSAYSSRHLSPLVATFKSLLSVARFFDLYHAGKTEEALMLLDNLGLIPVSEQELSTRVDAFRGLPEEIRRNFAEILVAEMTILYRSYAAAKSGGSASFQGQQGRDEYLEVLRRRARILITFSGMIQFRLPGDTNARLVRMEVLMN
eukprot:Opistho-2@25511